MPVVCVLFKLVNWSHDFRKKFKEKDVTVPWRIIKDTRNFYVHAYGAIDVSSVWNTLSNDIPALKTACEKILKD